MNKIDYKQIYLHIITEQRGIIDFDIFKYITFLKACDKFDCNDNIINEHKDLLIDVPKEMISYCITNQNKIISFDQITSLMKYSKHFSNIKTTNTNPIYFSIFNFSDDYSIQTFHYTAFKINDDVKLQEAVSQFKQQCSHLAGFCGLFSGVYFICINDNNKNIQSTIYHELSHYIQKICKIRITPSTELKKNKIYTDQLLDRLNILMDDLMYYFNSTEFTVHVDQLIVGLFNTHSNFYSDKNILLFFLQDVVQSFIDKTKNPIDSQLFYNYSIANDSDCTPLIMLIGAYYINHKYQKICYIVKQKLNQLASSTKK